MCEPTTLAAISLALTATSTVVQHRQQQKAYAQQSEAIAENYNQQVMDLNRQAYQTGQQNTEQLSDRALAARRQLALIETMNAEFGGGQRLAVEAWQQRGQDLATIRANRDNQLAEIGFDKQAGARGARNQLASLNRPSALSLGLKLGAAAADYGSTVNRINANKTAAARGKP